MLKRVGEFTEIYNTFIRSTTDADITNQRYTDYGGYVKKRAQNPKMPGRKLGENKLLI